MLSVNSPDGADCVNVDRLARDDEETFPRDEGTFRLLPTEPDLANNESSEISADSSNDKKSCCVMPSALR